VSVAAANQPEAGKIPEDGEIFTSSGQLRPWGIGLMQPNFELCYDIKALIIGVLLTL
jgi:hypothetical protein